VGLQLEQDLRSFGIFAKKLRRKVLQGSHLVENHVTVGRLRIKHAVFGRLPALSLTETGKCLLVERSCRPFPEALKNLAEIPPSSNIAFKLLAAKKETLATEL